MTKYSKNGRLLDRYKVKLRETDNMRERRRETLFSRVSLLKSVSAEKPKRKVQQYYVGTISRERKEKLL